MGPNTEPIEVESDQKLVERCITEFDQYRDYIAIIITLKDLFDNAPDLGRFVGPEVFVVIGSGDNASECTPDALVQVGEKSAICIEIKTGDGGNSEALVEEVRNASRYCDAIMWRTGNRKTQLDQSDLLVICTEIYWSKLRTLKETGNQDVARILDSGNVTVLTWEYHGSKIRLTRKFGRCRHQRLEDLLRTHHIVPTDNALLVEHSTFMFTPKEPPSVYTAAILLTVILPPRRELKLSIEEIHEHTRKYVLKPIREGDQDQIRMSWITKAMETLEKCNFARKEDSKFSIKTPQRAAKESLTKRICERLHRVRRKPEKAKFEPGEDQSLLPDFV